MLMVFLPPSYVTTKEFLIEPHQKGERLVIDRATRVVRLEGMLQNAPCA